MWCLCPSFPVIPGLPPADNLDQSFITKKDAAGTMEEEPLMGCLTLLFIIEYALSHFILTKNINTYDGAPLFCHHNEFKLKKLVLGVLLRYL